jgi:hypothetical protein
MTISNGSATGGFPADAGGGIYNDHSTLTVDECALSGNSADYGGGIFSNGNTSGSASLTVTNSTFDGNSAIFYGGGIFSDGGAGGSAILTINNSTFSENVAAGSGGGAIMTNGGGLNIANSTLSGNSAPAGGGGGILNFGVTTIGNTILKTGATGENLVNMGGTITSAGYNLSNDNGGGFLIAASDQINTDPILGPLKDNGGPTFTHAPLSNSPAIDRGKDIGPTGQDQRGMARPVTYDASITPPVGGDRSDIGAVELAVGVQPTGAVSLKTHGAAGPFSVPLSLTGPVEIECRGPTAGPNSYQVIMNFANPVTYTTAAVNDGTGVVASDSGSGTNQITLNLTGVTDVQRITLALYGATDTVTTNSGDVGLRMGVLIGDTTNNGGVTNASDVALVKAQSGNAVGVANFRNDVTVNGAINASDVGLVKSKSGNVLPAENNP